MSFTRLLTRLALLICLPFALSAQTLVRLPGPGGLAPSSGGWVLVQAPASVECNGVSTCSVTTSAIGTGNVLVLQIILDGSVGVISSVTGGGGTWLPCNTCSKTFGNNQNVATYYNLSSSTASTTVTANSTSNIHWGLKFSEWTPPSGATAYFDTGGTVSDSSCSSCAGVGLTLNGTNDIILQMGNPNNSLTAITGGAFSSTAFFDENLTGGEAYAAAKNTNNGTAPTWTQSPSGTYVNVGAIAISTTPPPAGPSFVQACGNIVVASGTTITCTMSTPVTAGHALALHTATYGTNTLTVTGDTGTVTSVYNNVLEQGGTYGNFQVICNAVGGETVIGNTLTTSIDHPLIEVYELSNVPTSGCVDTFASSAANGNSTTATSNNITPAANNEMLIGAFIFNSNPTITAGTNVGWTMPTNGIVYFSGNASTALEYFSQSTIAAINAQAAFSGSTPWYAEIVAIK